MLQKIFTYHVDFIELFHKNEKYFKLKSKDLETGQHTL